LWFILAVAAVLRLWRLGTPSLWFDEVLVAMVAKLPSASVVARSLAEDFHPPAFYLLAKAVMEAGMSDAVLRLPLAAFGLAGVWYAWRVGREMLSEGGGLMLAALTAVQPWHLLLSRQLRPYSIVFLFSLAAFFHLWRAIRDGRARDFLLSSLFLWPPVVLHFSGLLAMGGAGLVLLLALALRRARLAQAWPFFLACGAAGASILPFLSSLFRRESGITGGTGYDGVLGAMLDRLSELLLRELYPGLRLAIACAALFGLLSLLRRDRLQGLVSLGWFVFPLMALVAVRYSTYFNPWHLTFLLPPVLLWQAQAVRTVTGERALPWLAALLALAGGWWYLDIVGASYYQPESYSGQYRQQASRLLAAHSPGTVYVYPQSGVSGPLNWYLDQFSEDNPLRAQRVDPDMARVRAVTPGERGTCETVIERSPVIPMDSLPFRTRITAAPADFLSLVNRLELLACQPVLEDVVVATQAARTGFAEFVFENRNDDPQRITVHFGFSNRLPGNRLAVLCRFDDGPWEAGFESLGPDPRGHDKIELVRDHPYRTLAVRFELFRDGRAATFTGEDMEAVRLLDFKVEADREKS
jgi:hypothetical protein